MKRLIAVGVSAVFLLGSLLQADLGQISALLRQADLSWLTLALVLSLPQVLLSALRWSGTSRRLGVPLPLKQAEREYYRSYFLNQVLPFGVWGDALRASRHAKGVANLPSAGLPRAAIAVLAERGAGQIVLLLCLLLSLPFWKGTSSRLSLLPADGSFAFFVGAGLCLALVLGLSLGLLRRFEAPGRLLDDLCSALFSNGAWFFQGAMSLFVLLTLVLQYFCVAKAVCPLVPAKELLLIALPTLVASALPFAFSGWGTREACGGVLFGVLGFSFADGVTVGILFGLIQFAAALPGLVFLLWDAQDSKEVSSGARYSVAHAVLILFAASLSFFLHATWPVAWAGAASLGLYLTLGPEKEPAKTRFHAANLVTLLRVGLVAALGAEVLSGQMAAGLTALILLLDGLDGWLARRFGTESTLGARLDMETDALLVLVAGFVIFHSEALGAWILFPGLLRYFYVLAMATGALAEAPPSRLGRAIFVVVAVALIVSLWPFAPLHRPLAFLATCLVTYSFARSVRWSQRTANRPGKIA